MTQQRHDGEWLKRRIERHVVIEAEGWAVERARRVEARLQAGTPPERYLRVLVPWLRGHSAFTAPGRYIYVSRRLLERCPDDDALAMIVAHEIAHHELGHLRMRAGRLLPINVLLWHLERRFRGSEQERAADLRAIELCVAAGYRPHACLAVFELLAHIALDRGDVDGVLGVDGEAPSPGTHPPLRAREQAVREHLARLTARQGGGVFRAARIRAHCGECAGDAVTTCRGCERPLCAEHAAPAGNPCACCGASGRACASCRVDERCLACGAPARCRYCRKDAETACPQCGRVFCGAHGPGAEVVCVSCRAGELQARAGLRSWIAAALAVAIVLVIIAGVLVVSPRFARKQRVDTMPATKDLLLEHRAARPAWP